MMYCGYDAGFHSVKLVGNGHAVNFESFAARPASSMLDLSDNGKLIVESERIEGAWMVGQHAVKMATRGHRQEVAQWINTPEYLALFYAALGQLSDASRFSVDLVTGLPILDFERDRERLRDLLLGDHRFSFQSRSNQFATVQSVRVVPQGWGGVLAMLFDARGKVQDADIATQKVGVIDVGGRTCNYLAVAGLSDLPSQNKGTDRGAWHVVRAVKAWLDTHYPGLSSLQDHEVMRAIIAGEIYHKGQRVDLAPVVCPIVSDIASEIVNTASQYWGQGAPTFRRVFNIGGGAYLFGPPILAAFGQATVPERPEFTNAQGYHNFGAYLSKNGSR
jgi:plasmid segregation protein ParM